MKDQTWFFLTELSVSYVNEEEKCHGMECSL